MNPSSKDNGSAAVRRLVATEVGTGHDDIEVTRPAAGFSDSSYDVHIPGRRLMARIANSTRPEGLQRERAALTLLHETGARHCAPRLATAPDQPGVKAPEPNGLLLREFLPGIALDRLANPDTAVDAAVRSIAEVHVATAGAEEHLQRRNPGLQWDAFVARAQHADPTDRVRHIIDSVSRSVVLDGESCLLHGDLNPSNLILDSESGRVAIIDWERAATGPAVLDLGSFAFAWLTTFGNEVGTFLNRIAEQYAHHGGRRLTTEQLAGASLVASRFVVPPQTCEYDDWLFQAHLELLYVRNRRVWLDLAQLVVGGGW